MAASGGSAFAQQTDGGRPAAVWNIGISVIRICFGGWQRVCAANRWRAPSTPSHFHSLQKLESAAAHFAQRRVAARLRSKPMAGAQHPLPAFNRLEIGIDGSMFRAAKPMAAPQSRKSLQDQHALLTIHPMQAEEWITKRCKRYILPNHAHELTFTCYQNRTFLGKDRTCRWLAESIIRAREELSFSLWAYVFMPNHVHLLIYPRTSPYSISQVLHRIKQPVAKQAIAWLKQYNPEGLKWLETNQKTQSYRFWQKGGGYDRNITNVETLIEAVRYIHQNPVRKELAPTAAQWFYSSAACWENPTNGPISIDRHDWPAF